MSQILLYLILTGLALLLYALTRPKPISSTELPNLQGLQKMLEELEQEQANLNQFLQHTLRELEQRVLALESKIDELQTLPLATAAPSHGSGVSEPNTDLESSLNLSPRHKEVVNLLRQGQDVTGIAQQTGVGIGEIQLLERLLRQKQGDNP
jgi:hypothetical protein